jgi:hypothetical protein
MLRQLQIHRRIIQDISVTLLAPLPSLYQRLLHLASFRDQATGRYRNDRLAALYSDSAVQEALTSCHQEILERILETPLEFQENDLRQCLESMPEGFSGDLENWQMPDIESRLLPEQTPEYLKQLFRSNLRVLLQVLGEDCPAARQAG